MTELDRARHLIDRLPYRVGMVMAPFYVLVFGIRELVLVARLRRRGLIAEGTVVDNVYTGDSADGPDWAPVIAFTDNAGNHVEFTPVATGGGLGLATGSTVQVIYLPEASPDARVNTAGHLLVPGFLAVLAGVSTLAISLTLILVFTSHGSAVASVVAKWVMAGLFLVAGLFILGAGIHEGRGVTRLRHHGLRTRGRVIDSVASDEGSYCVVGFTDHRGQPVEFTRPVRTRGRARVGRTVTVMYLPDQPDKAQVDSREWWLSTVVLVMCGTVMLTTGAVAAMSPLGGM